MAAIEIDDNGIRTFVLDDGTSLIENVKKLSDLKPGVQYVSVYLNTPDKLPSGRFYESVNLDKPGVIKSLRELFQHFPEYTGVGLIEVTYNDGHHVVARNLQGGNGLDLYYDDDADIIRLPHLLN